MADNNIESANRMDKMSVYNTMEYICVILWPSYCAAWTNTWYGCYPVVYNLLDVMKNSQKYTTPAVYSSTCHEYNSSTCHESK